MTTANDLIDAHYRYLLADERHPLPHKGLRKVNGMRASDLGRCSVQWALEQLKMEPTHPMANKDHGLLHRFEQGHRIAEIWQEAVMHYIPGSDYEYPVEGLVSGTVDILLPNRVPVEIKNTNYRTPQDHHLLQLWNYMIALKSPMGFLIFQRQDDQQIFEITYRGDKEVEEAIGHKNEMLDLIKEAGAPKRPLDDVMPHKCVRENAEAIRPNTRRDGRITVSCPFFGQCYGLNESAYNTHYNEGGMLDVRTDPS